MDPHESPARLAPVDRIAADAWRFGERLGWIEAGPVDGRRGGRGGDLNARKLLFATRWRLSSRPGPRRCCRRGGKRARR